MLTDLYIDALLSDESLADDVWALWNAGVITDELAALALFAERLLSPKSVIQASEIFASKSAAIGDRLAVMTH